MLDSERAPGEHAGRLPGRRARSTRRCSTSRRRRSSASRRRAAASRRQWRELLKDAIRAGLDVENGLHEFVTDDHELVELAREHGVELRDLRKAPPGLNVPTGENLTHGATIVLTVGSDCAIGKMTVALELDREARSRGIKSEFVPTGQTGIAIAGWGISVDAVVSDFIAGAAEQLVVEGVERGGELLLVEGQGSLLHPCYSGVTLGLIHGSAPHAYVLCHKAGERFVDGDERFLIPPLSELVDLHERMSLLARPGQGARDRAQHARPRRGGGARARSRRPRRRPGCRRTIRSGSGQGSWWTRSNVLKELGRCGLANRTSGPIA